MGGERGPESSYAMARLCGRRERHLEGRWHLELVGNGGRASSEARMEDEAEAEHFATCHNTLRFPWNCPIEYRHVCLPI